MISLYTKYLKPVPSSNAPPPHRPLLWQLDGLSGGACPKLIEVELHSAGAIRVPVYTYLMIIRIRIIPGDTDTRRTHSHRESSLSASLGTQTI